MIPQYKNPWFQVVKDGKYHYLVEDGSNNGAIILALVKKRFVFVRVNRPAHSMDLVEAPRGYGHNGESSEACAIRELFEETGHKFELSDLDKIGKIRPNSAILSSIIPVYLIESDGNDPIKESDNEVSSVVYIPAKDIYDEVFKGNITDGCTLSALALYWSRNRNNNCSHVDA